jgi:hypothetical protein
MSKTIGNVEYEEYRSCGKALYLECIAKVSVHDGLRARIFSEVKRIFEQADELKKMEHIVINYSELNEKKELCHMYLHYKGQRQYEKIMAIFRKSEFHIDKIVTHRDFKKVYRTCADVEDQWPSKRVVTDLYNMDDPAMGPDSDTLTRKELLKKIATLQHESKEYKKEISELYDTMHSLRKRYGVACDSDLPPWDSDEEEPI